MLQRVANQRKNSEALFQVVGNIQQRKRLNSESENLGSNFYLHIVIGSFGKILKH